MYRNVISFLMAVVISQQVAWAQVSTAAISSVDFTLRVGDVAESVEVTGEAPLVQRSLAGRQAE